MLNRVLLGPLCVLLIHCGGSSPPAATTPSSADHHGHHGPGDGHARPGEGHGPHNESAHEHHHEGLSPAQHEFHRVLAPVWHSDAGPARVTKACAEAATLREKAKATADAELISSSESLVSACEKDRAQVETTLSKVHDRFHAIAKH